MYHRFLQALSIVTLSLFSISAFAQSEPAAQTGEIKQFTLYPARSIIRLDPGATQTLTYTYKTNDQVSGDYSVSILPIIPNGERGGVEIMPPTQVVTGQNIPDWSSISPRTFSLAAGGEQRIDLKITVPASAEPGGFYATLLVRREGSGTINGAQIDTYLGTNILLTVNGTVSESAKVESFKTDRFYYGNSPVHFEFRVKNNGSVHIAPTGTVTMKRLFGTSHEAVALDALNVLPTAIRSIPIDWYPGRQLAEDGSIRTSARLPWFGIYRAELSSSYGDANLPLTATSGWFLVMAPRTWAALLVLVALILAATVFRKPVRRALHRLTADR
jgi:hypothetical protein